MDEIRRVGGWGTLVLMVLPLKIPLIFCVRVFTSCVTELTNFIFRSSKSCKESRVTLEAGSTGGTYKRGGDCPHSFVTETSLGRLKSFALHKTKKLVWNFC